MFQVVNEAFNTLSVPELRAEYDGLFRMRCVLEQGSLTEARLREQPLDLTYMFAVTHRKGLGMREESVLIVNLQDGPDPDADPDPNPTLDPNPSTSTNPGPSPGPSPNPNPNSTCRTGSPPAGSSGGAAATRSTSGR